MSNKKIITLTAIVAICAVIFVLKSHKTFGFSTTNSSASLVIGQSGLTAGSENQGGGADANTLKAPNYLFPVGSKLIVSDYGNHRILIYNTLPTSNNASANVVVGQQNMSSNDPNQGGSVLATTLNHPTGLYSDGTKLFIADSDNNRVLIYNTIPTSANASANVVVGQADKTHNLENQGGGVTANTLDNPSDVKIFGSQFFVVDRSNNRVLIYDSVPTSDNPAATIAVGQPDKLNNYENQGLANSTAQTLHGPSSILIVDSKLLIADTDNHRVLIFNSIPTGDNAAANFVIGQADMTHFSPNRGGSAAANTLDMPTGLYYDGSKLYIADFWNSRVLVYNSIPTSNGASANYVIGQASMSGADANQNTGGTIANGLSKAWSSSVMNNKLLIADYFNNRVTIYDRGPALAESSSIVPSNDTTPNYTFTSSEAGTITYGGDCTSSTTSATVGSNTITFGTLGEGTHSNCTVTVTNAIGYASDSLVVTPFSIDTTAPTITDVTDGTTYHTNVAPTFSEGSATLNGAAFTSGTTISEDGDYTLVITDSLGNSSTIQFKVEKVATDTPTLAYSALKKSKRKITLTFYGLNIFQIKKAWVSVRIGGKKFKVVGVSKTSEYLKVRVNVKYGRMAIGGKNLVMTYRTKVNKKFQRGTVTKNTILTII